MVDETQHQETREEREVGSEEGSRLFVANDKGMKRTLDVDDAEDMAAKKTRMD